MTDQKDDQYDVVDPATLPDSDPGDEADLKDEGDEEQPEPVIGTPVADDRDDAPDADDAEAEPAARPAAQPQQKVETRRPVVESDEVAASTDAALDPRSFLDEELAAKMVEIVRRQDAEIARLREMLDGAGIVAPREQAVSRIGEKFPDVFGAKGSPPSDEQSEARSRLVEAADVVRTTYARRGKPVPGWDEALGVAMSVEFPDLAAKARDLEARARKRESQRLARPAARESGMSPEERATRAARKFMLENSAFLAEVPDLG